MTSFISKKMGLPILLLVTAIAAIAAIVMLPQWLTNPQCSKPIIHKDPNVTELKSYDDISISVEIEGQDIKFYWQVENGSLSSDNQQSATYTPPSSLEDDTIIIVVTCDGKGFTEKINFTVIAPPMETPTEVTVIGSVTPNATATPIPPEPEELQTTPPATAPSEVISPPNAKQVAELARWGKGTIEEIAYSSDGKLAVASSSGVYLYDSRTQSQTHHLTETASVSVAFNANGQILASGSKDGTITLWQVSDGTLLRTLNGHTGHVSSLAFSKDEQRLISGSRDSTVRLWQVLSDDIWFPNPLPHTDPVESVAISPDGQVLASGSQDNIVKLWRINNREIKEDGLLAQEHTARVDTVAFSPDGELLASGDADGTLVLWRMSNRTVLCKKERSTEAHGGGVRSVAFSPDGKRLASGSYDKTVLLWDVEEVKDATDVEDCWLQPNKLSEPHTDSVESIAFSPDGETLASRTRDNRLWLWRVEDGMRLHTLNDHTDEIRSVAFSAEGKAVATGSWDNTVRLWTVENSRPLSTLKDSEGNTFWVNSVIFSPDSQRLAVGGIHKVEDTEKRCLDGTVWRWQQADEWQEEPSLKENTQCIDDKGRGAVTDTVTSIAFSPDGQMLVTGSLDNDVRLWQMSDRTRPLRTFTGHTNSVLSVAFSPDGQMLASGSWDKTVRLWQVSDGTLLNKLEGHAGLVRSVAFSPDGQILASGSSDNTVRLWQSNGQLLHVLTGHTGSVFSVAFSPDGQTLASGALDGTIRLWQVSTGDLLQTIKGHTNTVYGVAFSPDGKMLVSGSRDGTVRLWGVLPEGVVTPTEESTVPIKEDVIKIGAAVSETGRYAREGKDVRQGYDLWADWVNNERGGIQVGDKRYNVEMIYYDDESDPDIAAKLVQILIAEDEVHFLLGPYSTGLTSSTSAISEKYDVIMVEANGSSESLFERGFKNLFAVLTPGSQYTNSALKLLAERGAKSVVIAHKEDAFSKSIAQGAQRWAEEYGLQVLDLRPFPESEDQAKNAVPQIMTQFRDLEPDVFVAVGHYKEALLFVEKAKELDFNPKAMVIPVAPSNPQFVEDIGADANYIIGPTQWEEEMSLQGNYIGTALDYAEHYDSMWNERPTYQAAESTAAALALMVAMENAGSLETATVRAALNALDIETFYGRISFDETGKNVSKPMGVIQIQNGEIKVIESSEEMNYPAPPWSEQ